MMVKIKFQIFILLLIYGCANRGTPSGGEIDKQPPVVIKAQPKNFSTNFNNNKIEILFDEYIKLNGIQNELIISPPIDPIPIISPISSASKLLTISKLDSLKANTTYSFHFGESIEDNNERNPIKNYRYVFSTGNYIDSLKIKGSVKDGFNRQISENISVLLYEIDSLFTDSIIYKSKPKYVAKVVDSTGLFKLQNIKEGKYQIIALEEENKDYIYQNKVDKIGFTENFLEIPNDSIANLIVFKESLPFKVSKPKQKSNNSFIFGFEGNYEHLNIKVLNNELIKYKGRVIKDSESDSLVYWKKNDMKTDSIIFEISNKKLLDSFKLKIRDKGYDSLIIKPVQNKILKFNEEFTIQANTPFEKIEKNKISIIDKDSVSVAFEYKLDSLYNKCEFSFNKVEEEEYSVKFLPGALIDFFDNTNDTLLYKIKTKTFNDFGNLKLNLINVKYPIIVHLINKNGEVKYEMVSKKNSNIDFNNIDPGKYFIRIIFDKNENNIFDSGNYLRKIKPEKVIYFPDEIDVRAGWDLIQEFILK